MTADGRIALMVFTRDLRVSDNPALAAASSDSRVICAFVHDDALRSGRPMDRRRTQFLTECLADLDASLRRLGSRLEQRQGRWVEEVLRLVAETGAHTVHLADDVTPYAQRRFVRLEAALGRNARTCRSPGLTIVPPGLLTPTGGDHYRVFSPFYRRWLATPRRQQLGAPSSLSSPDGLGRTRASGTIGADPVGARPGSRRGGERAAVERLAAWGTGALTSYGEHRDDLADPATSRLSADLHFGCLSPLAVESAVAAMPGAAPFLRQLCWRDFYMQILAARPHAAWSDYVPRGWPSRRDPRLFEAWCTGRTGIPIVDAAMRQLSDEAFLPNRARMIAASFLARNLGLDWRDGAGHFLEHLLDADVALNNLNWQWTAGLGTGANPQRVLSPTRQARRFDPVGAYVRRHVPELRGLGPPVVHEPWRLGRQELERLGYVAPVVPVGDVGLDAPSTMS
jgi:deoxyribodipyrimidine photo-lyase